MKRALYLIALLAFSLLAVAQNTDSLAFVRAKRHPLRIKGANGYTVAVKLFGIPQNISVIKYSPKRFTTHIVQPQELTRTSELSKREDADFAINACFWNVKTKRPITYVKRDGKVLSQTVPSYTHRVNGLVLLHDNKLDVIPTVAVPDYVGEADRCDNAFASGPVLLDNDTSFDYEKERGINASEYAKTHQKQRRHPRSVIGCDRKENIYLVVVDGRSKGNAEGMTMPELTALCRWIGMKEAINLDGGGSSTLWSRKHGIINYPCDNKRFDHKGERKVSSCVVVKRR